MIDGHIHFESRPYTLEGLQDFIKAAQAKQLDEIWLLEHTHRFIEWQPLYQDILGIDEKQDEWYLKKQLISIKEYQSFITEMRKLSFPIKVKFGLEVCFFPQHVEFIKNELASFPYDFAIGSVHFVDNVAYDIASFSKRILWDARNHDEIYRRYYELMKELIQSDLFNGVAHPDTIKLFNYYPSYDLTPTYLEISDLLNEHHMFAEDNGGCYYRYHHKDKGLSDELLKIFKEKHVQIQSASDAHVPEHVGMLIQEINEKINS
ncbi:MAG: PHP domain-containing protein [Erysipelotrichaceae bacterium]